MAILNGKGKVSFKVPAKPVDKIDYIVNVANDAEVTNTPSDNTDLPPIVDLTIGNTKPAKTKNKNWLTPALIAIGAVCLVLTILLMLRPSTHDDTYGLVSVSDTLTNVVETPVLHKPKAPFETQDRAEIITVGKSSQDDETKLNNITIENPEEAAEPKPNTPLEEATSSTADTKQEPSPALQNVYVATGTRNGHDYVDLGLSVKWAFCNVGAGAPSSYGSYFAWGETSTKVDYSESTSKWYGVGVEGLKAKGVINSSGNLTRQYDAAAVNWGGSWRMPTLNEIKELSDKCTWTWTTLDGKSGYKVVGPNGNTLFIPATGYRGGSSLFAVGSYGHCWSSSACNGNYYASSLDIDSSSHGWNCSSRYYGRTVRPVIE